MTQYRKGDSFAVDGERSGGRLIDRYLFIGLGKRVIALEKSTGREVWEWNCPRTYGHAVTMLVEEEQIFVSANGYIFCLNARTGRQMWENPLKGKGLGIASLATTRQSSSHEVFAKRIQVQQQSNGC